MTEQQTKEWLQSLEASKCGICYDYKSDWPVVAADDQVEDTEESEEGLEELSDADTTE